MLSIYVLIYLVCLASFEILSSWLILIVVVVSFFVCFVFHILLISCTSCTNCTVASYCNMHPAVTSNKYYKQYWIAYWIHKFWIYTENSCVENIPFVHNNILLPSSPRLLVFLFSFFFYYYCYYYVNIMNSTEWVHRVSFRRVHTRITKIEGNVQEINLLLSN